MHKHEPIYIYVCMYNTYKYKRVITGYMLIRCTDGSSRETCGHEPIGI